MTDRIDSGAVWLRLLAVSGLALALFVPAASAQEIRINVNGPAHVGVDFPGNWAADPGSGGVCGLNFFTTGLAINGNDDPLFQGEAFGNPATCAVGGGTLPAGDYTINLYFAEIFFGPGCPGGGAGDGARVFDIVLEGTTELSGFDIHAEAGACLTPVVKSFDVTINDGTLDISLPATVNNGKISAIEIIPRTPCTVDADCDDGNQCSQNLCINSFCETTVLDGLMCDDGDPCTDADVCNGLSCEGVALVDGTPCDDLDVCTVDDVCTSGVCGGTTDSDNDGLGDAPFAACNPDPCPNDPRNLCFGPVAEDGTTGNDIRINANVSGSECSGAKTDCNGDFWYADYGFNTGNSSTCNLGGGGEGCVIGGIDAIFGCDDESTEDIFQCERWDPVPLPELNYSFDVPDGDYVVNLLFANTFTGTVGEGSRVFDILIEGLPVYDDFDQVVAAGGSGIAVVRSAVVSVTDGNGLQIDLGHVVENPAIKGIEVLRGDADGDGFTVLDGDCDDDDAAVNPDADELCDGIDNDCDGELDEPDAVDATTWYEDADGDTYGAPSTGIPSCTKPDGYVENDGDCNDNDATVNPSAIEICDGIDNDCDTFVDEGGVCCRATDAKSQGYWHRQCLGLPEPVGIDPGRFGRGPSEPSDPDFYTYISCADAGLEDAGISLVATCDGLNADPANDPCEKALKQLTALILNVCSERLSPSCGVDVSAYGCSSSTIGDLIQEVGALIGAGECSMAASCAGAVNEGNAPLTIPATAAPAAEPTAPRDRTRPGLRPSRRGEAAPAAAGAAAEEPTRRRPRSRSR